MENLHTYVCKDVLGDVLCLNLVHDLHLELKESAIVLPHQLSFMKMDRKREAYHSHGRVM
jgi:hypothetical protein